MDYPFIRINFIVWSGNVDQFVDKIREHNVYARQIIKEPRDRILGCTRITAYGPKDRVDAICDLIKKEGYDVELTSYIKDEK